MPITMSEHCSGFFHDDCLGYRTSDSRHGCSTIITLTPKFSDGKIKLLQDIAYNRMQYACLS